MPQATLTELIQRAGAGDQAAAQALFDATYAQLRRLARARLRGGARSAVLDTGSLVHESYLRFAQAGEIRIEDRVHFLRWAASVMRSVIVDSVRRERAARRGGDAPHVTLTAGMPIGEHFAGEEILHLHEALNALAARDSRLAHVVELRYFAGMTDAEIAQAMGVTDRTVRRDWEKARLLLREALA
jgi:RNA polymerase sigma factor (TIGR02999 family)